MSAQQAKVHRVIVIGRGMIGAAAARHLSARQDGITLLGPEEPRDAATHQGVFASHYDEGRLTRIADANPAWAVTAKRSIERYPEIESKSGIRFFYNSGYLGLGEAESAHLNKVEAVARGFGADIARLDRAGLLEGFPFLDLPPGVAALHERATAGHVSPRAMVRAQAEAARQQGTVLHAAAATRLTVTPNGVEVACDDGATLRADKVLVAAGAFSGACGLVPEDLDLRVFGRTVVFARCDGALAEELQAMPTLSQAETGAYILPPIRYPDGETYVKIGQGSPQDKRLVSLIDLQDWFKGVGAEDNRRDFRRIVTALIPALERCRHWHSASCAVTQTASGLPIIDFLPGGRVAVAVGGNGKGAKSSDDWGYLAACLVAEGDWDHPVRREDLALPARGKRL